MDPRNLFHDDRLAQDCTYCGGQPSTRDHVPSKVLLDEPYPEQLPVVKACEVCNGGFSLDEEYLACFVACVLIGSVRPNDVERPKVARLLREKPALAALISQARTVDAAGTIWWKPDDKRIRTVVLKLARGHATFENAEACREEPAAGWIAPLPTISRDQRTAFETPPTIEVLPEIGTRAFERIFMAGGAVVADDGWQVVQPGRYRYLASFGSGVVIRVVLSEYLAGEVVWT